MAYLWKGWPEPVQGRPQRPAPRTSCSPTKTGRLVAEGLHDAARPRPAMPPAKSSSSTDNKIQPNSTPTEKSRPSSPTPRNGQRPCLSARKGDLFAVSATTGKVTSYDAAGKATPVIDGIPGPLHSRHAHRRPLRHRPSLRPPSDAGAVWFIKDGKKTLVDSGLKRSTGLAYRPDQWLLSVADGNSKWVYSYQINPDGTLANKERFFPLHVADWDDDAGAESVCYAKEGQMFVATRTGIQICADDGPTQVILPLPDRARVQALCLGGKDMDTLYAFTADKIWKRKLKIHGITAGTPITKINGTPL